MQSPTSPDALKFHRSCLLVDLHVDALLTWRLFRYDLRRRHPSPGLPRGTLFFHADVPRFRAGNVGAAFLGLVPKPFGKNAAHLDEMIREAERVAADLPELCTMARSAEDVERARAEGKTALLLGIEGATAFDGDPRRVRYFARRGVRYVGLVHFNENFAASPGVGLGSRGSVGLTARGRFLVEECVRNHVLVDLAHLSPRCFFDAIELLPSGFPSLVSHAGVKSVHEHGRNLDDDQLRAVASTGGVVGVINQSIFLGGGSLDDLVAHVLAARDVAGYRHVAIGSDFDGAIFPVKGLEDVTRFPALTAALLDAGLPKREVRAILGENALRVLAQVPPKHFPRGS
ncbi:MAG: membrane dipeptidase [Promethearchaeota archaeon]